MEKISFKKYWLLALASAAVLSAYPVWMGIKLFIGMSKNGYVPIDEYPKYAIPYVPIAVALLFGVLIMPLAYNLFEKKAFLAGSISSVIVFYIMERTVESKVIVASDIPLESWQMSLCYVPPEGYKSRAWEAVNVLLGGYSAWFKLHFYIISVLLILAILNSVYGFANMVKTGDKSRKRALTVQSVAAVLFLGMCIWACFTAFYRGGELEVSPLSAVLMSVFFVLMGFTAGIFTASFLIGKKRAVSVFLPSIVAALVTLAMYAGELILLSGNLYRFGSGAFFEGLSGISLAPVDIALILLSGVLTWAVASLLNRIDPEENLS